MSEGHSLYIDISLKATTNIFVRSHTDFDNEEEITIVLSSKFKRERERKATIINGLVSWSDE